MTAILLYRYGCFRLRSRRALLEVWGTCRTYAKLREGLRAALRFGFTAAELPALRLDVSHTVDSGVVTVRRRGRGAKREQERAKPGAAIQHFPSPKTIQYFGFMSFRTFPSRSSKTSMWPHGASSSPRILPPHFLMRSRSSGTLLLFKVSVA